MKKSIASLLLLVIGITAIRAQGSETEYNFLRLPVSAHAAALGGYNISVVDDDATLMFGNPALASSVSDKTINLNYMNYMEGVNTASASFVRVLKEKATLGITAQYMDYGTMKEVDENNIQTGDFSAKDIALAGILAYQLGKNVVGGITARMVTSAIGGYHSLALGVDLGVNWYLPERDLSLSAVVKNLGGELDAFEDVYGKLPLDLQVGATKRLTGSPLQLSATLTDLNHLGGKFKKHVVVGADLILSPQVYVAVGYNFRRATDMEVIADDEERGSSHGAGLSLGAGLHLDRLRLDISYGKYHVSSHSLNFNLAYKL